MPRRVELCVDCNDPERVRPWWRVALGWEERPDRHGQGTIELVDPGDDRRRVWFQPVPEPKSAKNRLHLDVYVDRAEADSLRDRLVAMGGVVLDDSFASFVVMADPEGNELCICWD